MCRFYGRGHETLVLALVRTIACVNVVGNVLQPKQRFPTRRWGTAASAKPRHIWEVGGATLTTGRSGDLMKVSLPPMLSLVFDRWIARRPYLLNGSEEMVTTNKVSKLLTLLTHLCN
jgi:hypothetical protein